MYILYVWVHVCVPLLNGLYVHNTHTYDHMPFRITERSSSNLYPLHIHSLVDTHTTSKHPNTSHLKINNKEKFRLSHCNKHAVSTDVKSITYTLHY